MDAFASLSNDNAVCPLPSTPVTPAAPARPSPVIQNVANNLPVVLPVSEDVIRSCVTSRKVRAIQKALERETNRHKCALKLMTYFFTREELGKSNTDGSHGKEKLDSTKLNSLKV